MNIDIVDLSATVEIEKQEKHEQVLIKLTAKVKSDTVGVVAAGVDVDSLEVLPSVKIDLIDGEVSKEFPPVKIFRQYLPEGEISRDYTITVAIGTGQKIFTKKDLELTF